MSRTHSERFTLTHNLIESIESRGLLVFCFQFQIFVGDSIIDYPNDRSYEWSNKIWRHCRVPMKLDRFLCKETRARNAALSASSRSKGGFSFDVSRLNRVILPWEREREWEERWERKRRRKRKKRAIALSWATRSGDVTAISLVRCNAHRKGRGVTELGKPTLILPLFVAISALCRSSRPHPSSPRFPALTQSPYFPPLLF